MRKTERLEAQYASLLDALERSDAALKRAAPSTTYLSMCYYDAGDMDGYRECRRILEWTVPRELGAHRKLLRLYIAVAKALAERKHFNWLQRIVLRLLFGKDYLHCLRL